MKALRLFAVALAVPLSSGCGYRIVRNSDVTAIRFAQDSASIATLERRLAALNVQCRADSARLVNDLAEQRAAVAAMPPPATSPDSVLKARTVEIATLKDQLTKVNAELDRIKRRLAKPRG